MDLKFWMSHKEEEEEEGCQSRYSIIILFKSNLCTHGSKIPETINNLLGIHH